MNKRSTLPRIFVSSVIEGLEAVRTCARKAIKSAGGEPVLFEDFHSQNASSRNACLDGVGSCDALIIIIGSRGGYMTPSGKVVVEEEYDEAKRLKLPILFYLQEIEQDKEASVLSKKLSGYIDGRLRAKFNSVDQLKSLLDISLPSLIENLGMQPTNKRDIQKLLLDPTSNDRRCTLLRTVIASERCEEFEDLVDDSKLKELNILALQCDLFAIEPTTNYHVGANSLTLTQSGGRGGFAMLDSIALYENGVIVVESLVEKRDVSNSPMADMLSYMFIDADQMEERLGAALRFVFTVFEKYDPYSRYGRFLYNASLHNYDGKIVERSPQPRPNGVSLPMYNITGGIVPYDEPKVASRADLSSPKELAAHAINRLVRHLNAANSNQSSC